eukprot:262288-Pelagomonas_calceolata.AAC.3
MKESFDIGLLDLPSVPDGNLYIVRGRGRGAFPASALTLITRSKLYRPKIACCMLPAEALRHRQLQASGQFWPYRLPVAPRVKTYPLRDACSNSHGHSANPIFHYQVLANFKTSPLFTSIDQSRILYASNTLNLGYVQHITPHPPIQPSSVDLRRWGTKGVSCPSIHFLYRLGDDFSSMAKDSKGGPSIYSEHCNKRSSIA